MTRLAGCFDGRAGGFRYPLNNRIVRQNNEIVNNTVHKPIQDEFLVLTLYMFFV